MIRAIERSAWVMTEGATLMGSCLICRPPPNCGSEDAACPLEGYFRLRGEMTVKILIADDDRTSLRLLERRLSNWGYEVTTCDNGDQVLAVLQEPDAPKLAILDWVMPGISGPEICGKLRGGCHDPYVYVILLTSRNQKEDVVEGLAAGADDYLTKPFDANELKVRVRAAARVVELQDQLRSALELAEFRASHDALTGLPNRASVMDVLGKELTRAGRENSSVGVIVGDIDYFKKVNDTHGHLAGDAVLRSVAHILQQGVRPYDTVGRYGGEEFLVVLPGCDSEMCATVAERMRRMIEETPLMTSEGIFRITMSLGAAAIHSWEGLSADEAVRLADGLLYQAKDLGRNRVEILESTESTAAFSDMSGAQQLCM
jgi:diguanylate cyclase (GGDEF)-like protein